MIRKDYIMRMVEQMTKMLARVLLLKEEGNVKEAINEIDASVSRLLGIDALLLEALPADNIADMFGVAYTNSPGSIKCFMAGKLLKEKADILVSTNRQDAMRLYHKAFELYCKGMNGITSCETDVAEYVKEMAVIEEKIKAD